MDKVFISSASGFKEESINKVKALFFDTINEDVDLWDISDDQAKQTCAFIDGITEYARHLIKAIETAEE